MTPTILKAIELWKSKNKNRSIDKNSIKVKYVDDDGGFYTVFFQSNGELIKLKVFTLGEELKLIELK